MRCSSCEPLLDDFLEGTLSRREMRDVAHHLRRCPGCEALLAELRVVDALLTTARAPGKVDSAFTAAVVSKTAQARQAPVRRVPLWVFLIVYLALAWSAVGVVALRGNELTGLALGTLDSISRGVAALQAVFRAIAPATSLVAAFVTAVLLLDLFLLAAIAYGYRRVRPMLATRLGRGPRT
jgi:anti-sigma factor RsiW